MPTIQHPSEVDDAEESLRRTTEISETLARTETTLDTLDRLDQLLEIANG